MGGNPENSVNFDKLIGIAEKVISIRNLSLISEINPDLSKSLDRLLHELAVSQTDILKQNQSLKEARDKYYDLYENSPIGYLSLNPNGIITESNSTTARLLRLPKNDLLQNPFARFITYEDRPFFYAKFGRLQNDLSSAECRLRLFAKNAVLVPVNILLRSLRGESGALEGHSLSIVPCENNDGNRINSNNQNSDLYASIFQKNNSPCMLIDAESGAILNANDSACRFYGRPMDDLLRVGLKDLSPEMSDEQWRSYVHRTFSMKKELMNLSCIIAYGKKMNIELHSTPVVLEGKRMIFCIAHDVTEKKELEDQLYDYLAKLRKLNEDLSKYAMSVVRNARNPFFAAHKYTDLLIRKVKESIRTRIKTCR